jgi:tellurium resistance protein TerZ
MILDLQKGMSLDLSKVESNLTEFCIGVNWGMISHKVLKTFKEGSFLGFGGTKVEKEVIEKESVDLDASAILYDSNNQIVDIVYYRNKSSKGVSHSGDDLVGDDKEDDYDNETIIVNLTKLNTNVKKIVFVLVSFRGQDFATLPYAGIKLYDNSNNKKTPLTKTKIDITKDAKFSNKTSMVFAILENKNNNWEYRIVAEPTNEKSLEDLIHITHKF